MRLPLVVTALKSYTSLELALNVKVLLPDADPSSPVWAWASGRVWAPAG